VQQRRCEHQPHKWLKQLQLPDGGDAPLGEPAIPEHEADEHAEQGDVGERDPGRLADLREGRGHRIGSQGSHHRQGQNERPRDHLPTAEFARQLAPLRVAHAAHDDGREHQQIAGP